MDGCVVAVSGPFIAVLMLLLFGVFCKWAISQFGESNGIRLFGDMPVISVGTIQLSLVQAAAILWLVGVIVFAGWNAVSYIRLKRKLRISVRWEGQAYFADGIRQPFVLPGFPSRIYLPSGLGVEGASNILWHEQIHVRRKDPWLNLLAAVILGIYWFHPAVWAGIHYFRRDMEMSCDEAAVAGLDAEGEKAYILDLLHFSVSHEKWAQFPCAFGEKGVVGRMKNLKKEKVRTKAALLAAGALVVAAALILIPNAQEADEGKGRSLEVESAGVRIEEGLQGAEGSQEAERMTEGKGPQEGIEKLQEAESLQEIGRGREAAEAEGMQDAGDLQGTEAMQKAEGQQGTKDLQKTEASQGDKKPLDLQESLEQYFTELYSTLSDDAKNFSSKDFASVDSYMVWKRLQMRRYLGDTLYGGIDKVRLQEVEMQSQEERGGQIEAMVFVKTLFDYRIYRGLPKKARSQEYYTIYKVAAIQEEDGYRILDFSSSDEFYGRVRKSLAEGDAGDRAGNDVAVDAYFEKLQGFQECLERYFIEPNLPINYTQALVNRPRKPA